MTNFSSQNSVNLNSSKIEKTRAIYRYKTFHGNFNNSFILLKFIIKKTVLIKILIILTMNFQNKTK